MSDFHGRMMNIQAPHYADSYERKVGHRDARHAAAEIALEADAEIERLTALLHETQDRLATARGAALVQGRNFDPAVRAAMAEARREAREEAASIADAYAVECDGREGALAAGGALAATIIAERIRGAKPEGGA